MDRFRKMSSIGTTGAFCLRVRSGRSRLLYRARSMSRSTNATAASLACLREHPLVLNAPRLGCHRKRQIPACRPVFVSAKIRHPRWSECSQKSANPWPGPSITDSVKMRSGRCVVCINMFTRMPNTRRPVHGWQNPTCAQLSTNSIKTFRYPCEKESNISIDFSGRISPQRVAGLRGVNVGRRG